MVKVVLINPPSTPGYIRSGRWTRKSRANQSWFPIWLSYCTALLEREGHDCFLLDASVEGLNLWQTTAKIKKFNPNYIIFYWGYDSRRDDLSYANFLAEKYQVILVGPWSHCLPDALQQAPHVKAMTYGEFEHTVLELLKTDNIFDIKGIYWRNHITKEIIKNPPRELCSSEELDEIPFVTDVYKRHLDLKKYRQTSFRYPFVDLLSARGCPFRCSYCLWIRAFQGGPSYRARSISNVLEELWFIKNELPEVKQIHFQDDTLPTKRAKDISQAILDENLKITWSGYARADLSFETLKLMKESGCRTLHVGYETNDEETLKLIHKDITVEQMEEFAKSIQKLNMWTCAGFMIFPWQSKETIRSLIKWVKKEIKPKRFSFTQLFAYPNTPICKTIKEKNCQLTLEEMTELEKEGFKEYYLKNPSWWWDTLKHPREWKNVCRDALGLVNFLWE